MQPHDDGTGSVSGGACTSIFSSARLAALFARDNPSASLAGRGRCIPAAPAAAPAPAPAATDAAGAAGE